jgi:hypothetical protein
LGLCAHRPIIKISDVTLTLEENAMKVTFDFVKRQIGIEGDAPELVEVLKLAREVAPKLPDINILTQPDSPRESTPSGTSSPVVQNGQSSQNGQRQLPMREWARRLSLNSNVERITALGYYITKIESHASFSPKEMSEWFAHCGFQKPTQMPVAIFDAKKKYGYVENLGHGRWKLTTSGENLMIGKLEAENKQGE